MKTENPITEKYLKNLGFKETYGNVLEDGDFYRCLELTKDNFTICCTNTYSRQSSQLIHQYFELNGETLTGCLVTKVRLESLISLL